MRRRAEPRRAYPEDRIRRLHPHAVGDAAVADEPHPGAHANLLAQLFFGEVEGIGLALRDTGDSDVALLIVQRRKGLREDGERIRHGTPELARMHRVVERPDLDVARVDPAERDRESRLAIAPVSGVGQDHRIGAKVIAVPFEELREIGRSPLRLVLYEYSD